MGWTAETLSEVVDAEIQGLPEGLRLRFDYISEIIERVGLERTPRRLLRHLEGPLWEIRMKGKEGYRGRSIPQ